MIESLTGRIVSLQVGMPHKRVSPQGRDWHTAIHKTPVAGRVPLGAENLAGDYQANRKYHGGPDKAVCAYSAEHYPGWRALLAPVEVPFGAFGENVTVEDMTENIVCIGDVFRVGTATLQVSQPRQPCANVSKRWNCPDLPARIVETGRTGFYLRVLEVGEIGAGDTLVLLERAHAGWTLARANTLMYDDAADRAETEALRALPLLSAEWKRILGRKLAR